MGNLNIPFDAEAKSEQNQAVYDSNRLSVVSISKQEENKKYYFRLMPFNAATMSFIGVSRPEIHVKKYMFKSPIEDGDGNYPFFVTVAESTLRREDRFAQHVTDRLNEMMQEGDVDGLNRHNALFSGPYTRSDVSPDKPLMPNEIGVIEVWVAALPVSADLVKTDKKDIKSVATGDPIVYNIKTSGRNHLFGRGGKKPIIGVTQELDDPSDIIQPEDGVDFWTMKAGTSYTVKGRREKTTVADYEKYYADSVLPNGLELAEQDVRTDEAIKLYDVVIGKMTKEQYASGAVSDNVEADESITEGM